MKRIKAFFDFKGHQQETVLSLTLVVSLFFGGMASYASAATQAVSLTVTVQAAMAFNIDTNNFSTIQPGTVAFATTTLEVTTNDSSGYLISLYGGNKGTGTNNFQTAGNAASIQDAVEFIPGLANSTTTTNTLNGAVKISSLANGGNVLAFRVMSASSTNGVGLLSTSWWGTQDTYVDNSNTLWGGIASTTGGPRVIGYAGTGTYSTSVHDNTVLYYLNVATTQPTGNYTAPLTYTATGN